MTDKTGFAVSTTIVPLLPQDGRRHFARRKTLSVRLLEWTVAALWLLVAAVGVAAAAL